MTRFALTLVPLLLLVAPRAQADAHAWHARAERFEVDVTIGGFDEGAGEGGWDAESAREMAAWARRFEAIVPRGARVTMRRDAWDDETALTIHDGARTRSTRMSGGPDFDSAIAIVARHFGVQVPPTARGATPIYTLQVMASRSRTYAEDFARALDARGVVARDTFYDAACMPCSVPVAHVLEPGRDAFHRVVVGVYDRPARARRALAALEREFRVRGWVTVVPVIR